MKLGANDRHQNATPMARGYAPSQMLGNVTGTNWSFLREATWNCFIWPVISYACQQDITTSPSDCESASSADRWGTFPLWDHRVHQLFQYDHTEFGDTTGQSLSGQLLVDKSCWTEYTGTGEWQWALAHLCSSTNSTCLWHRGFHQWSATQSTPDHSGLEFPDDTMPQVLLWHNAPSSPSDGWRSQLGRTTKSSRHPELWHGHWMGACCPTILHLDSGIRVPTHTDSRTFIWPPSPMALSQDLANNRHQLSIAPD